MFLIYFDPVELIFFKDHDGCVEQNFIRPVAEGRHMRFKNVGWQRKGSLEPIRPKFA